MKIELTNEVILTDAPLEVYRSLERKLNIPNPEFWELEYEGRDTGDIPMDLELYRKYDNIFSCPGGAASMVSKECSAYAGKKISIHDNRRTLNPVNITFHGELGPLQQKAADLISKVTIGIWEAPNETDRIIMALYLAELRKQRTLILVDTEELLKLWVDYIGMFSGIKAADVGIINNDEYRLGEKITVGMVQTLNHQLFKVKPDIGHLILDERSGIMSVKEYLDVIQLFDCKYQLWLTSSPADWDYFDDVVELFAGPIIEKIEKQELLPYDNLFQEELLPYGNLCQGNAFFIPTGFTFIESLFGDPAVGCSNMLTDMTQNLDRNRLIVETTMKYKNYDLTLILSERQQHCEYLAGILKQEQGIDATVLTGKTPAKEREQIIKDLISGKCRFLIATNQLIEKGFDLPKIGTLVLATPIKFSGRHIQYIGRTMRPGPGRHKTLILNFVDDHEVFASSARTNWEAYKQHGFTVMGTVGNNT